MDWIKKYADKQMSADEAVSKFVKNGDFIFLGSGQPAKELCTALFDAIEDEKLEGIIGDGALLLQDIGLRGRKMTPEQFRHKTYFYGGYERSWVPERKATYVPLVYSNMGLYYEMIKPDVVFTVLSMPDEEGYCNVSCFASGQMPDLIKHGKTIIAEFNPNYPRVHGADNTIHIRDLAAFMVNEQPLPLYPVTQPTELEQKISDHILEHVPDGACIQLGIGGMPNALGYGLRSKKDIGIHSEMLTASMVDLMKEGVVNNSRKNYMPGIAVCGFALGEQAQYDFVNNNPDCYFLPHSVLNRPDVIGQNDNFISVNNALEMDLCGSICSDTIGFRQFSGVGGQIDFVRGATYSKGGKSFIAATSSYTDKKGELKSRIVLDLVAGAQVTTLRSEIMYVVTEYGCVNLWGQDIPTRAKMMIGIAHPQFREELTFQAKQNGLLY